MNQVFATKLPKDLVSRLDSICRALGLRKNFVIEEALREKIEDLLDAEDLRHAMKEATGFHAWHTVKKRISPVSYRIEIETRAEKELADLPKDALRLLSAVIDDLQQDPRPPASKKLSGVDGYRIRKGDYRILYSINGSAHLIRIYRVGRRKDVYRRLH